MKKRNLKSLSLNKKSISDLNPQKINGGNLEGESWARCSEVMSCITYTQNNETCGSCLSIHLCISVQICTE
ncbi:hypothetical protein [Kordia sp.]|uniref:hypothetical protein n=1 Tax=Kordia sp. TaxID=1965332 RepID=UPI003D26C02A